MFEFKITKQSKTKARRRRQKNEKKWILVRIVMYICILISLISFGIGIFAISDMNNIELDVCAWSYAISLGIGAICYGLLRNLSSHWIQDRLNEQLWIQNGILYHFVQTAFAAGWNIRHADSTARVYEYDLSTIKNPKYDPKSGRIEFNADGKLVFYKNYHKNIIGHERQLQGKPTVFYEYMNPSLYTYLSETGVKFKLETLDFKIRDPHV